MTGTDEPGKGVPHEVRSEDTQGVGDREKAERPEIALSDGIAAAARKAGLGPAADGEPDARALLRTMGGVRGIVETILPGVLFLVGYTLTQNLPISLAASVGVAVLFSIARLIARTPVTQALAGLVGVGASAGLSLITNRPEDNFLIGLYTNAGYGVALLVSVLVGWPLVGLAVGYLMGDGTAWRKHRGKFRAMQILTLCWVAMFALRLAVQLPLYLAGNVEWLAATKLLMGLPLYAPVLLLSWLIARSVFSSAARDRVSQVGE